VAVVEVVVVADAVQCKTVYLTSFGTNITRIGATKEVTSYRRAIELEASHIQDAASNSVLMYVHNNNNKHICIAP